MYDAKGIILKQKSCRWHKDKDKDKDKDILFQV